MTSRKRVLPLFLFGDQSDSTPIEGEARAQLIDAILSYLRSGGVITPSVWGSLSPPLQDVFEEAGLLMQRERDQSLVDRIMETLSGVMDSAQTRDAIRRGLAAAEGRK